MVWPPFPGPLWGGVCVCQWDMGQMVDYLYPDFCQESLHLGIKRVSSWVTVKQKLGISLILWSVTLSLL